MFPSLSPSLCSSPVLVSTKLSWVFWGGFLLVYFPPKDCLLVEFCFSFDCTKDVNWWCHDKKPSPFMDWMATITARTELLLLNPLWIPDDGQWPLPPRSCVCGGFSLYLFYIFGDSRVGSVSSTRGFRATVPPFLPLASCPMCENLHQQNPQPCMYYQHWSCT